MKQDKSKWISVLDELPKKFGKFRVRNAFGEEFPAFFTRTAGGQKTWLTPSDSYIVFEWQPLPEPPKPPPPNSKGD